MNSRTSTQMKILVMQHFVDGGSIVQKNGSPVTIPMWDWLGNDYNIDEYEDLRKVQEEGAIIEKCYLANSTNWIELKSGEVIGEDDRKYRIKGNLTIRQWDIYKEAIKAFWVDGVIEYKFDDEPWKKKTDPKFITCDNYQYRVTLTETVHTIAELENLLGIENLKIKGE